MTAPDKRVTLLEWRGRLDELARLRRIDQTFIRHLRDQQERLAEFMLRNGEYLLGLAIERAEGEQCAACGGFGFTTSMPACDELVRHRCATCGGTG